MEHRPIIYGIIVIKINGSKVFNIIRNNIRIDVQYIACHMIVCTRTVTTVNCAVNYPCKTFRTVAEIDRVPRRIASDRTAAIDIVAEYAPRQRDRVARGIATAIGMTAVYFFLHDMCSLVVDKDFVALHIAITRRISAKKATTEAMLCKCERIVCNVRNAGRIRDSTACRPIRTNLVVSRNRRMCIINDNIRRRHILRRRKESAPAERDRNEQSQTT